MPKQCKYEACENNQFGGGYCNRHQWCRTDKTKKKIRFYSKKREKVQRKEYVPKMLQFLIEHPVCMIQSPECSQVAECINHIKGRQSVQRLLDLNFWESSCSACNMYIERFPGFNNGMHKQSKF